MLLKRIHNYSGHIQGRNQEFSKRGARHSENNVFAARNKFYLYSPPGIFFVLMGASGTRVPPSPSGYVSAVDVSKENS